MDDGKYVYVDRTEEQFERDETVTNHEVIYLNNLKERWVGAKDEDIVRQNRLGSLPIYSVDKINRTQQGEIVRVLSPFNYPKLCEELDEYGEVEGTHIICGFGLVCLLPDVMDVENRRPDFLSEIITLQEEFPSLVREDIYAEELETKLTVPLQRAEAAEQALAEVRMPDNPVDGHGLCSTVIKMRGEGKSDNEIAQFLYLKGKGCSYAQIGALLHPTGLVSSDAMKKYGEDLVKDKTTVNHGSKPR